MTTELLNFLSLTCLQVILMIDNLIFISVLTESLLPADKSYARKVGLVASLILNTCLILLASLLTSMESVLFTVMGHNFTFHNLILFFGGLFLLIKVVKEIRCKIDKVCHAPTTKTFKNVTQVIINMILIDLVFSIDSTIIAIGMTDIKWVQIASILLAILMMYFCFNFINKTTDKYPSLKILALSFLFLIGFSLFASGLGFEIPKSLIYSVMAFSLLVEFLNIRVDSKAKVFDKIVNRKEKESVTEAVTEVK